MNLYRDLRNTVDVDELEKKLAVLENAAATVIRQVYDCTTSTINLRREQVNYLRKFMFVMHYRSYPETYFDPTMNNEANAWVEELLKREHLSTPIEAWLHILRYYLDTDHRDILIHGEEAVEKVSNMIRSRGIYHIPPDLKHYEAIAYRSQGDYYYLGFWEAADEGEFVLTNNGFGLWEGIHTGFEAIHRIFPMGPRIVAILRSNMHRSQLDPSRHSLPFTSQLLNIPLPPPVPLTYNFNNLQLTDLAMHRASPEALKDIFSLSIIKLTAAQTSSVNSVLLCNVREAGAMTFLSRPIMLKTLEDFAVECVVKPFLSNSFDKFIPLVKQLCSLEDETAADSGIPSTTPVPVAEASSAITSENVVDNPGGAKMKSTFDRHLSGLFRRGLSLTDPSTTKPHQSSTKTSISLEDAVAAIDKSLDDFFQPIPVFEDNSFPSSYDQGRRLWDCYSNIPSHDVHPFAEHCEKMIGGCISNFKATLGPPPPTFRPRNSARLPMHLDHDSSRIIMDFAFGILEMIDFEIETWSSRSNIGSPEDVYKDWGYATKVVVAFGCLTWVLQNRHDLLQTSCPGLGLDKLIMGRSTE
ncbi:hypothetical protein QCA50_009721 [Cerrena zonata]|uniref:Uncharacterized protein n=1 Tax=Cerrena zonata TaxID=2478898 RepID=A0AAW0G1W8_9APHY